METSPLFIFSLSLSRRLWTPSRLVWQFGHETKHEQAQINKWETPGHKCLMSPEPAGRCCDDERGKHTITSATSFSLRTVSWKSHCGYFMCIISFFLRDAWRNNITSLNTFREHKDIKTHTHTNTHTVVMDTTCVQPWELGGRGRSLPMLKQLWNESVRGQKKRRRRLWWSDKEGERESESQVRGRLRL